MEGRIKYGLMVVDPTDLDEDSNPSIVHFCGYWNKPDEDNINHLREEISTDETFGLTEIVDRFEIYPAPFYLVEYYANIIDEMENDEVD